MILLEREAARVVLYRDGTVVLWMEEIKDVACTETEYRRSEGYVSTA